MSFLILPTAYLGGCVATMSVFSYLYRRATNVKVIEPWFPENDAKEKYIALLNTVPPVAEHHLQSALLKRAMEGVRRVLAVQQEKPALLQLLKTGHLGDDVWQEFQAAEQETMQELQDIALEANTFKDNWSKTIFTTASQMLESDKQKQDQKACDAMREQVKDNDRKGKCSCEDEHCE
ncbi:hypothetical protein LRAMOSA07942 [Lichtheimia ramosa]|uniref:Translocation protein sec66 n=1 Tax=Lichtheimia ramosa TaxID=688394 RepID=A0A077WE29_9FUNG|nr:hypothetical protein LRAMOSA07942 [Lichtheimia ramosa]